MEWVRQIANSMEELIRNVKNVNITDTGSGRCCTETVTGWKMLDLCGPVLSETHRYV
jgi:hypothetical protein